MMDINAELVDKICAGLANADDQQIDDELEAVVTAQPDLLDFLLESLGEAGADAEDLGMYLFLVIWQTTTLAAAPLVPSSISDQQITAAYQKNVALMTRMGRSTAPFEEKMETLLNDSPSELLSFLLEALADSDSENNDEDYQLTDAERSMLFLTIKTVVDVLEAAVGQAG